MTIIKYNHTEMRCHNSECKKKINTFSTTKCICGYFFCDKHRLPFEHQCTQSENKKTKHKQLISDKNPKIEKDYWNLKEI